MVTTHKNVQEVGREMCESKIVRKFSFTGSTAVAKLLYSMSASTLKKCAFGLIFSLRGLALIGEKNVDRSWRKRALYRL